jgi:hypothetical protein
MRIRAKGTDVYAVPESAEARGSQSDATHHAGLMNADLVFSTDERGKYVESLPPSDP